MASNIKSGKEILDQFFNSLDKIENVDPAIASLLSKLYKENSLTEKALKNELEKLREDGNKN